jgi:hypothetical protein
MAVYNTPVVEFGHRCIPDASRIGVGVTSVILATQFIYRKIFVMSVVEA